MPEKVGELFMVSVKIQDEIVFLTHECEGSSQMKYPDYQSASKYLDTKRDDPTYAKPTLVLDLYRRYLDEQDIEKKTKLMEALNTVEQVFQATKKSDKLKALTALFEQAKTLTGYPPSSELYVAGCTLLAIGIVFGVGAVATPVLAHVAVPALLNVLVAAVQYGSQALGGSVALSLVLAFGALVSIRQGAQWKQSVEEQQRLGVHGDAQLVLNLYNAFLEDAFATQQEMTAFQTEVTQHLGEARDVFGVYDAFASYVIDEEIPEEIRRVLVTAINESDYKTYLPKLEGLLTAYRTEHQNDILTEGSTEAGINTRLEELETFYHKMILIQDLDGSLSERMKTNYAVLKKIDERKEGLVPVLGDLLQSITQASSEIAHPGNSLSKATREMQKLDEALMLTKEVTALYMSAKDQRNQITSPVDIAVMRAKLLTFGERVSALYGHAETGHEKRVMTILATFFLMTSVAVIVLGLGAFPGLNVIPAVIAVLHMGPVFNAIAASFGAMQLSGPTAILLSRLVFPAMLAGVTTGYALSLSGPKASSGPAKRVEDYLEHLEEQLAEPSFEAAGVDVSQSLDDVELGLDHSLLTQLNLFQGYSSPKPTVDDVRDRVLTSNGSKQDVFDLRMWSLQDTKILEFKTKREEARRRPISNEHKALVSELFDSIDQSMIETMERCFIRFELEGKSATPDHQKVIEDMTKVLEETMELLSDYEKLKRYQNQQEPQDLNLIENIENRKADLSAFANNIEGYATTNRQRAVAVGVAVVLVAVSVSVLALGLGAFPALNVVPVILSHLHLMPMLNSVAGLFHSLGLADNTAFLLAEVIFPVMGVALATGVALRPDKEANGPSLAVKEFTGAFFNKPNEKPTGDSSDDPDNRLDHV